MTAAVDDAFKVERENRRGRSIRVPIGPTGLANEPLFAYGGYPRLFPRGNTPGATFHRVARGDGGEGFKISREPRGLGAERTR